MEPGTTYIDSYFKIERALSDPLIALEHLRARGIFEHIEEIRPIIGFGGKGKGHKDLWEHTKQVVQNASDAGLTLSVKWAALFHDVGKPRCFIRNRDGDIAFHGHERLGAKMTDDFFAKSGCIPLHPMRVIVPKIVELLGDVEGYSPKWSDSGVRRLGKKFENLGDISVADVTELAACDCTSKHREKCEKYAGYAYELRERIFGLRTADAKLPALPTGLGTTLSERFKIHGHTLGQVMKCLQGYVELGELPRSSDHEIYVSFLVGFDKGVWSMLEKKETE